MLRQSRSPLSLLPPRQLSQISRQFSSNDNSATTTPAQPQPQPQPQPQSKPNAHEPDDVNPSETREPPSPPKKPEKHHHSDAENEPGPMSRRLQQATEEALLTGGRAGRRAIEDAGFSEELKHRLLNKIADVKFQDENAAALTEAGIGGRVPDAAGEGTRHIASAQPWIGEEAFEDAALRMLNDARKPLAPGLRGRAKGASQGPPVVDMRLRGRGPAVSAGRRAAGARDKAQVYAGLGVKGVGLSEEEREELRKEFRERFQPGARAMPNTITGLAMLANERWVSLVWVSAG